MAMDVGRPSGWLATPVTVPAYLTWFFTSCLVGMLLTSIAHGFTLFDAGGFNGYTYLKWGDPAVGTGATVSYSFLPVGTAGAEYCGDACPGVSAGTLPIWDPFSQTFVDTPLVDLAGYVEQAQEAWAAVADLTFSGPVFDAGLPINDPAAQPPATGQMRLGVFGFGPSAEFVAGVGYAPPPNGGSGEGDILFNDGVYFQISPCAEGEPLDLFPPGGGPFMNDFPGLLLHEMGHALGLAHPLDLPPGVCSVMSIDFDCYRHVNRVPDADDIRGIRTLYGFNPDLNGDGMVDCADLDLLSAAIRQGSADAFYDLDLDGLVTSSDRTAWLAGAGRQLLPGGAAFLPGDANLDGFVDTSDFNLWNANKFTVEGSWCRGDFDGNGVVDTSDFNVWNGNKFRASMALVPEPDGRGCSWLIAAWCWWRRGVR